MRDDEGYEEERRNGHMYASSWTPNKDVSAIKMRLDTQPVLRKLQIYLLGIYERPYEGKDGVVRTELVQLGEPKVNDIGYQSIMFHIESIVNSQTVQGNIRDELYDRIIADFHEEFFDDVWKNSDKYGIKDEDFNGLIASVTNFVRMFITRPIDNKERESYGESMTEHRTFTDSKPRRGLFSRLGF